MMILSKALSIILLGSIFLNSCGAVTPIPEATPTVTVTATRQPSTVVPTLVPTEEQQVSPPVELWKHLPPSQLVDQYELTDWSPEFYKTMNSLLDTVDTEFQQPNNFRAALASEGWLRTNSKMNNNPWLCDVNYYRPMARQFPELRPDQDLFSFFIEDLINKRGIPIDGLADELPNLLGTSDCLSGFSLNGTGNIYFEQNTVKNIFGDGQASHVLIFDSLFSSPDRVSIYATHTVDGVVHVVRVRDWEQYFPIASSYGFQIIDVGDLNRNGRNEFVVQVDFGASGDPVRHSEWIYLYEWDKKMSSFKKSKDAIIFSQPCENYACYGHWQLVSNGSSDEYKLITQEYIYTGFDECELITYQKEYSFRFGGVNLLSSNYLLPSTAFSACQIAWAHQVLMQPYGWKNDRAIQIISAAILDWPEEMDSIWGTQSKDYFQLMLGLWMDFRGEANKSFDLLDPLRTQQHNSKLTFVAQLSETYLASRQQSGMVIACSNMNTIQSELLDEKYNDKARRIMGFWDPRWINSADNICNVKEAFSVSFQHAAVTDEESLINWLALQGEKDVYIQKINIADEKILFASFLTETLQKYDINIYQFWAFSVKAGSQNAVFLNTLRLDTARFETDSYNENSAIVRVFEMQQNPPILLAEFDNCLSFLQVTSGEVKALKNKCEVEVEFSLEENQIDVMVSETYPRTWDFVSYGWDSSTQSLQETPSQHYDFNSVQDKAESLVYHENNYTEAIAYIKRSLLLSPPDRIFWPECYDYIARRANEIEEAPNITLCEQPMEFHRPYLLYLLGVSYEMSGQPKLARSTYYSLWHDYPTNIFGVAASLKLEEVSP